MGSKVWRLANLQARGRKSGTLHAGPCLLLQNKRCQHPGQTTPSHPVCSSAAGPGTGVLQLRPRRTHGAGPGTRAQPPASTSSPRAGPNCRACARCQPPGHPSTGLQVDPTEALVRGAPLQDCPP